MVKKINLAKFIVSEVGVSFKDAIYEVERSILCAEIFSIEDSSLSEKLNQFKENGAKL